MQVLAKFPRLLPPCGNLSDHKMTTEENAKQINEVEQVHTVSATNTTAKTYAQSLQEEIEKETAPKSQNSLPSKKSLQTEMHLFETTNQKGDSLTKLEILKNIAPTSVACESAFGLAGNIITRSRARLTDDAIDDLCFEKSYFLKENFYK